ncbi:MAG: pilin [Candidatus Saccharimonadales bacterium]
MPRLKKIKVPILTAIALLVIPALLALPAAGNSLLLPAASASTPKSKPCPAGYHRAGTCVPTNQANPVAKADLNCKPSQTPTKITGGTNKGKWYCKNKAAAAMSPPATTSCNLQSGCDLINNYVNPFINLLSIAFGLIAVISLIMGGIQYSTSQGDPQKSAQAKSRISNTFLAIFAYLFLYAFLQFLIPGGLFN